MSAIISMIWALIGPTLVQIAINVGLPEVVKKLTEWGLSKWIIDAIVGLVKAVLDQLKGMKEITVTAHTDINAVRNDPELSKEAKRVAVKQIKTLARRAAVEKCQGKVGCPADLKRD